MIPVLVRSSDNPIVTGFDVPAMPPDLVDPTSVFNPGATRFGDLYLLLWNRRSDAELSVDGDRDLLTLWREGVRIRWS